MGDKPIEIELDNAMPWLETLPDGRRAIVLRDEFLRADGGPAVLLILPRRDGWLAAFKLERAAGKITAEARAAERGDAWRGGAIIVSSHDGYGDPMSPTRKGPHDQVPHLG